MQRLTTCAAVLKAAMFDVSQGNIVRTPNREKTILPSEISRAMYGLDIAILADQRILRVRSATQKRIVHDFCRTV